MQTYTTPGPLHGHVSSGLGALLTESCHLNKVDVGRNMLTNVFALIPQGYYPHVFP